MQISYIVPVYNVEQYLSQCVDSLLKQQNVPCEILLVNDGSTDGSGALCDSYAQKHGCVKVFHKENGGQSSARNLAMQHARGEWVAFVDSDDWISDDFSQRLLPYMKPDTDVVFFGFEEIYPHQRKAFTLCDAPYRFTPEDCKTFEIKAINRYYHSPKFPLTVSVCNAWQKIYRRTFLQQNKISFNPWYFEDVMHTADLFHSEPRVVLVPDILYCYRKNAQSTLHGYKSNAVETMQPHLFDVQKFVRTYHPGDPVFITAYNARVVTTFLYYVVLLYCNPANPQAYKARKKQFLGLRGQAMYSDAFHNWAAATKGFPLVRKLTALFIKHKCFLVLELSSKLMSASGFRGKSKEA